MLCLELFDESTFEICFFVCSVVHGISSCFLVSLPFQPGQRSQLRMLETFTTRLQTYGGSQSSTPHRKRYTPREGRDAKSRQFHRSLTDSYSMLVFFVIFVVVRLLGVSTLFLFCVILAPNASSSRRLFLSFSFYQRPIVVCTRRVRDIITRKRKKRKKGRDVCTGLWRPGCLLWPSALRTVYIPF